MPKKSPHPLAQLRYYVTLLAATIAIFCFFILIFLVPFVYDPTISTLSAGFPERPETCRLSTVRFGVRLSACDWASCSEGCTAPKTTCVQLRVNVSHIPFDEFDPARAYPDEVWEDRDVPFRVNIQSCGYPPHVNCTQFMRRLKKYVPAGGVLSREVAAMLTTSALSAFILHAFQNTSLIAQPAPEALPLVPPPAVDPQQVATTPPPPFAHAEALVATIPADFLVPIPCYPSQVQPQMVIMDYDHDKVMFELVMAALVPSGAFVLCVLILCYCHGSCCKRSCPQLPIPGEKQMLTMMPPEVSLSATTSLAESK